MGEALLLVVCLVAGVISLNVCQASTHQRPSAAYAPLFTGVIKLADAPAYASPDAPAVISPHGRKRRLRDFPRAPELSTSLLERVSLDAASTGGRRKLQQQQQQQQQQQASKAITNSPLQSQRTAGPQPAATASSHTGTTTSHGPQLQRRQLLQDPAAPANPALRTPRPNGWSGLWWAEAGGIGLAAGPNHVIHAVSTVLAVYTVDPQTGSKQASKILALQDLFAPVGAANCKEGVYDAIPMYDKHAGRFLIAATCSGKGAVLLAAAATADPSGSWFLFNLVADGAGTGMACKDPVETALADSVRVTYNSDGIFLSLFNYCPSRPEMSGATILALPKHKVYKGAPNFVYGVFTADQIWMALQPGPQATATSRLAGVGANSFRQCQPAPPVTAGDAGGGAAYFVCDHIGPDSQQPRSSFTLVGIINTGALWQYAGTQDTSPTPFLVATLVDRGGHSPLSSTVMLQQPGGGSALHAGGTTPPGFWSGSAALSGGKIYTVDRVDITNTTVQPPLTPVAMPSLQWAEIDVKVLLSGAGDCSSTTAWGSKWDWTRDWSSDWGKDFDLEWQENKQEAEVMQQEIDKIKAAMQEQQEQLIKNCTAAAAGGGSSEAAAAAAATEIGDGSQATVDGSNSLADRLRNCTAAAAGSIGVNTSSSDNSTDQQQQQPLHRRRLAASSSSPNQQQHQQFTNPVSLAYTTAAEAAVSSSRYAVHWSGTPLPPNPFSTRPSQPPLDNPSSSSSSSFGSGLSSLQFNQFVGVGVGGVNAFVGWDLGCWYCATGAGGVYYSSSWFYRYWYAQWDFGWYKRYKRTYAPGWSHPVKWVGHRHMLQTKIDNPSVPAAPAAGLALNESMILQNDTMIIPPCLRQGLSYKNICKKCNYTDLIAALTVTVTRSGTVSYLGPDPLGFVAPVITVSPGGDIVILTGYSGPGKIPDNTLPAYPGIASLMISKVSTTATFKVLRAGVGKVRSRSGRWTEYSSVDLSPEPPGIAAAAGIAAAGSSERAAPETAGPLRQRLYYGVQWSQRVIQCAGAAASNTTAGSDSTLGATSGLLGSDTGSLASQQGALDVSRSSNAAGPVCAMPSPWLGQFML